MEDQPTLYWIILKKEMEEDSIDVGIKKSVTREGRLETYLE
jgi:hypothetical protein